MSTIRTVDQHRDGEELPILPPSVAALIPLDHYADGTTSARVTEPRSAPAPAPLRLPHIATVPEDRFFHRDVLLADGDDRTSLVREAHVPDWEPDPRSATSRQPGEPVFRPGRVIRSVTPVAVGTAVTVLTLAIAAAGLGLMVADVARSAANTSQATQDLDRRVVALEQVLGDRRLQGDEQYDELRAALTAQAERTTGIQEQLAANPPASEAEVTALQQGLQSVEAVANRAATQSALQAEAATLRQEVNRLAVQLGTLQATVNRLGAAAPPPAPTPTAVTTRVEAPTALPSPGAAPRGPRVGSGTNDDD